MGSGRKLLVEVGRRMKESCPKLILFKKIAILDFFFNIVE